MDDRQIKSKRQVHLIGVPGVAVSYTILSEFLPHCGLGEAHEVGAVAGLGVLEKDAVGIEYLAADHEDKGVL